MLDLGSKAIDLASGVSALHPSFFESSIFETGALQGDEFKLNSKYYKDDYISNSKRYNELKEANIKDPILVAKRVKYLLTTKAPPLHNIVANHLEENWSISGVMEYLKEMNKGLEKPRTADELLKLFAKIL